MPKLKLKKRKLLTKIVIMIVMIFIGLIFLIYYIDKKIKPILMDYAEMEITKLSNIIINKSISKQLATLTNVDDLFIITKENDKIRSIDLNPVIVNTILNTTVNNITINLKQIENGDIEFIELNDDILIEYDKENLKKGVIYEVPLTIALNNTLLNNIGPKVPIKFSILGDISGSITTKVTNYGLNNALIEVSLYVKINAMTILPLSTKKIQIENSIPIAIKIIQGEIPNYYINSLNREYLSE
jgi:sporulation protein YunB